MAFENMMGFMPEEMGGAAQGLMNPALLSALSPAVSAGLPNIHTPSPVQIMSERLAPLRALRYLQAVDRPQGRMGGGYGGGGRGGPMDLSGGMDPSTINP